MTAERLESHSVAVTSVFDRVRRHLPFLAILILALVLRLHGLTADGLWYDELLAITRSYPSLLTAIVSMWQESVHPPLFTALLHFWLQLGTGDLWIRIYPLVWNMLSFVLFYLFARKVFSDAVALLAGLFLALSPFHVYYAQEVRMYALMICLGVCAWYFTHEFFTAPGQRLLWGTLAGAACLAYLYSHGTGFLILVSVNTLAAWFVFTSRDRERAWKWVLLQVVLVSLYIPWLIHARGREVAHPLVPTAVDVARTLYFMLAGFRPQLVLKSWRELAPAMLLALSSTIVLLRRRYVGHVLAFVVVPPVFCYVVSYLIRPIWLYRTMAYTIPFICLTFALACTRDKDDKAATLSVVLRGGLALAVAGMLVIGLVAQKSSFRKQWDLREATAFVQQSVHAGDAVLLADERLFEVWNWYFVGPGSIDPLHPSKEVWASGGEVLVTSDPTRLQVGQDVWFVYREPAEQSPADPLLGVQYIQTGEWTLSDIHIVRLQPSATGEN